MKQQPTADQFRDQLVLAASEIIYLKTMLDRAYRVDRAFFLALIIGSASIGIFWMLTA